MQTNILKYKITIGLLYKNRVLFYLLHHRPNNGSDLEETYKMATEVAVIILTGNF